MATKSKAQQAKDVEHLRTCVPPGTVLYTEVVDRSRSGMSRALRVYTVEDGDLRFVTGAVAAACGYRVRTNRMGTLVLTVGGCGFSAGLDVLCMVAHRLGYEVIQREHLDHVKRERPAYVTAEQRPNGSTEHKAATAKSGKPALYWRDI